MAKMNFCINPDTNSKEWQSFIVSCNFNYVILEKIDSIVLKKYDDSLDFSEWEKCRLFGKNCELQIRNKGDVKHYVALADDKIEFPSYFAQDDHVEIIDVGMDQSVYLWGELDETTIDNTLKWFEKRIPHYLEYPVSSDAFRVKINTKIYSHTRENSCFLQGEVKKSNDICYVHRFVDVLTETKEG